eukprot:Clim_evm90s109 gene=Clim_evmTU90s109
MLKAAQKVKPHSRMIAFPNRRTADGAPVVKPTLENFTKIITSVLTTGQIPGEFLGGHGTTAGPKKRVLVYSEDAVDFWELPARFQRKALNKDEEEAIDSGMGYISYST